MLSLKYLAFHLTPIEERVYHHLLDLWIGKPMDLSISGLAKNCDMAKSTVDDALNSLKRKKFIVLHQIKGYGTTLLWIKTDELQSYPDFTNVCKSNSIAYTIVDPVGNKYTLKFGEYRAFARKHGLSVYGINKILRTGSYNGWQQYSSNLKNQSC